MDITRFHAAFFEESREGLDAMESGLLAMESGRSDAETINVIFRAAHSIKGGAAKFGFTAVTDLTHLLETLLDEARAGKRTLDAIATGALLQSVDVLRGLLAGCEHGDAIDQAALASARGALEQLLSGENDRQPVTGRLSRLPTRRKVVHAHGRARVGGAGDDQRRPRRSGAGRLGAGDRRLLPDTAGAAGTRPGDHGGR